MRESRELLEKRAKFRVGDRVFYDYENPNLVNHDFLIKAIQPDKHGNIEYLLERSYPDSTGKDIIREKKLSPEDKLKLFNNIL